jgi:hypothetical protein
MAINAYCGACGKSYQVKDDLAGMRCKCPKGHVLAIPGIAHSPAGPSAPRTPTTAPRTRQEALATATAKSPLRNRTVLICGGIVVGLAAVLSIVAILVVVMINWTSSADLAAADKKFSDQLELETPQEAEAARQAWEAEAKRRREKEAVALPPMPKEDVEIAKAPPEKQPPAKPSPKETPSPSSEPPVSPLPKEKEPADKKPLPPAKELPPSKPDKSDAPKDTAAFLLPFAGVGKPERIERLKVVRLAGRVTFASAINVNNIDLTYCWEPAISVRFEESLESEYIKVKDVLDKALTDKKLQIRLNDAIRKSMNDAKRKMNLTPDMGRQLDYEIGVMLKNGDYKAFYDTRILMRGNDVFQAFNQLRIPLNNETGTSMRNLCFALSISNLLPLKDRSFKIAAGADTAVKGVDCRTFLVQDAKGAKLDFAFDTKTDLLTKIAHRGNNPRVPGKTIDAQWDHYFSDYRTSDGITQWRELEIHVDGTRYATLQVDRVQYFDEIPTDMQQAFEMKGAMAQAADQAAEKLMKTAQEARDAGNMALARIRAQRILDEYPSSRFVAEARKLLASLPK